MGYMLISTAMVYICATSLLLGVVHAAPAHSAASASASAASLDHPVTINGATYNYNATLFGPGPDLMSKRTCSTYNTAALNTASAMQSLYYNGGGYYQGGSGGGSAWTDVNAVEDLMNMMLYNGATTYDSVPEAVFNNYDSQFVNGGSYDDLLWAVLASFKQCDYQGAHGRDTTECINRAIKYYNIVVGAWDGTCGGGVWWSSARNYKNAVTNELFLFTSAAGYLRTNQAGLLNNAKLTWSWLNGSGMRNSGGLYNDGLTSSCTNNGQTTWTYNQIVVAAGLGALSVATGDKSYLTAAEVSIDATIAQMESNNILKESCDSVTGATKCDADQQIFKGIFTKHLQYYLDSANDSARTAKYSGFLESQASGVVHFATGGGYNVGSVWYGPDQGGSVHSPKSQTSGLAALVAAAKYASGGAC